MLVHFWKLQGAKQSCIPQDSQNFFFAPLPIHSLCLRNSRAENKTKTPVPSPPLKHSHFIYTLVSFLSFLLHVLVSSPITFPGLRITFDSSHLFSLSVKAGELCICSGRHFLLFVFSFYFQIQCYPGGLRWSHLRVSDTRLMTAYISRIWC